MEEKITRRELFKRAARLLPIIALASIPVAPILAESVTDCNRPTSKPVNKQDSCKCECHKQMNDTIKSK